MCICHYRSNLTFGCFSFVSMRTRHTRQCCLCNSEKWPLPFLKQSYRLKNLHSHKNGKSYVFNSINYKELKSCFISGQKQPFLAHCRLFSLGLHRIFALHSQKTIFQFAGKVQYACEVSLPAVQLAPFRCSCNALHVRKHLRGCFSALKFLLRYRKCLFPPPLG